MPKVKVVRRTYGNGEAESLDDLLRRFRRQVNESNILGECRKREHFISNGEKKKERKIRRKLATRKAEREARRAERQENNELNFMFDLPIMTNPEAVYKIKEVPQTTERPQKKAYKKNNQNTAPTPTNTTASKPAYYSYRKPAPKKEGE